MLPLFSVVIPLYNKASYIARAVQSVLRQDFGDYEVIVIDDGSTDGGGEIVRSIGDARIKLVVQDNLGASSARKTGVLSATGRYVGFLDADDEWKPGFLSEMSALVSDYPDCGIYASAYEILERDGRRLTMRNRFANDAWRGRIRNYFRNVASKNLIVCSSAVVVRRSIITEDAFLSGRENMGEDQYLWTSIALEYPVAYSQTVLALYHRDAESSFAAIGPLKAPPCFVPPLAGVVRTGSFHGRAIAPEVLRQVRRYISENLVQLAIINARHGDHRAARRFISDPMARAKPVRLAAAAAYLFLRYASNLIGRRWYRRRGGAASRE